MALLARQSAVATKVCSASPVKAAPVPRSVGCKSYVPLELIAAGKDTSRGSPPLPAAGCVFIYQLSILPSCCEQRLVHCAKLTLITAQHLATEQHHAPQSYMPNMSLRTAGHELTLRVPVHPATAMPFCCSLHTAAGDVEAPIGVPIIAAIVVTAAVTFAVPAYLNRGKRMHCISSGTGRPPEAPCCCALMSLRTPLWGCYFASVPAPTAGNAGTSAAAAAAAASDASSSSSRGRWSLPACECQAGWLWPGAG